MENKLQIFSNEEFGKIRTVVLGDTPYFIGKDVAEILGYAKPENAVSTHVDDEDKTTTLIQGTGSNYKSKTVVINESGLYSLIITSKLPEAKKFKHWVTSEVLPSIRKHGAYMTPETLQEALCNPDTIIHICQQLKTEQEKSLELQAKNADLTVNAEIMRPKAEYFDELVDRNLLTNFTEASKQLGVRRKDFIAFMMEHGYLYRDKKGNLLPRANQKTDGLFEVKESANQKTGWAGIQTLLTPKGIETFRLLCVGA